MSSDEETRLRRELNASRGRTAAECRKRRAAEFKLARHIGGKPRATLCDALADVQAWQDATFGGRSPLSARVAKLREEVDEVGEACAELAARCAEGDAPRSLLANVSDELADCMFLVADIARAVGRSPHDLADAVRAKLEHNKQRDWAQRDDGTFHGSKGDG